MDSVAVTVPLRPPMKKMKKRKELDALAPRHAVSRRSSGKRSSQELLSDSSDDRLEYWNVSTRGRKCRGRSSKTCPNIVRACSAFLACTVVLVTASLIWLFIDLRQQLTVLRIELDQVIAGNEGVPDALQKCHSLSRDLRNNQTLIYSQISDLKLQINNYTSQITTIQHNLYQVQKWLQSSPSLNNLPSDLADLPKSVADLGSRIGDLFATVNAMKDSHLKMEEAQNVMQQNMTSIKMSLSELSNNVQRPQSPITNETRLKTDKLSAEVSQLTSNLSLVNETLSSSLKYALDDQSKDHKKLVLLQDTTQNVSMTLMSLQEECSNKQKEILQEINHIKLQLSSVNTTNVDFSLKLTKLNQLYNSLQNSTVSVLAELASIKSQQEESRRSKGHEKKVLDSDVMSQVAGATTALPSSDILGKNLKVKESQKSARQLFNGF